MAHFKFPSLLEESNAVQVFYLRFLQSTSNLLFVYSVTENKAGFTVVVSFCG